MMKPMDTERNLKAGYSHLLENPILFLLFSDQAIEEFSMLLNRFGDSDRYMVMQVCSDAVSHINNAKVISIERNHPNFDESYQRQLASAVRHTKKHKYPRGKDLTVCAISQSKSDYKRELSICEQIYDDLKYAYCNHIYFDFYIMAKDGFTPSASLDISSHMEVLGEVAKKDWTRYIFLVFDITGEESLIEEYSERFQAVLDSIILTNCQSTTGNSSSFINNRLLEESEMSSKFLSLGRIKMSFSEKMMRNVIRHELLNRVQQLPNRTDIRLKQLSLNGLKHDIQTGIEGIYPGIMHIASYRYSRKENFTHYTNHEVISNCFQSFADYYIQYHQKQLERKFREHMSSYCQREIKSWLSDALHQSSIDISQENRCEAISKEATAEIKKHRENILLMSQANEEEYVLWKYSKAKANYWRQWLLKDYQYGHYQVLKKWITFHGKMLYVSIFEQCLDDIAYYIRKWTYRAENHFKLFSLCCLNARELLEEMLTDCCSAEQHLIQSYRQKVAQELEKMTADIQHIRDMLNGFLQEEIDDKYLDRVIWQFVDRLYAHQLTDIKLYSQSDENIFDEILAKLENHVHLFTRTQIPNMVPYIILMGNPEDSFFRYACHQKEARYIVHETEYLEYPVAFYYQHIR